MIRLFFPSILPCTLPSGVETYNRELSNRTPSIIGMESNLGDSTFSHNHSNSRFSNNRCSNNRYSNDRYSNDRYSNDNQSNRTREEEEQVKFNSTENLDPPLRPSQRRPPRIQ
uniref:Uncharacterized protein n=1 Tax=Polytomella parva TaxID=51329 RepID=A0A7S0UQL9_9CHLO|mmetsp:Transcript_17881/g.32638  ORF Transcript_17881/g.32638 Transcript_17881/m.32638 type:complete len:113 (+) Transcript_17881:276-614(+)